MIRESFSFFPFFNDSRGRAVYAAEAVSNDYEDVLRGIGAFGITEVSIFGASVLGGRAISCVREALYHVGETCAAGVGVSSFTEALAKDGIRANNFALRAFRYVFGERHFRFFFSSAYRHADGI